MKFRFSFEYPLGQLLVDNFPLRIGFLHLKHDPIATFIAHVNMKKFFGSSGDLSKIKLSNPSGYLHMPRELYIFFELNMHNCSLNKDTQQFSCYSSLIKPNP